MVKTLKISDFFFFSQKIGKIGEKCDWKTNKIGFFEAKQEKLFFFSNIAILFLDELS